LKNLKTWHKTVRIFKIPGSNYVQPRQITDNTCAINQMKHWAKKEISHEELDKGDSSSSARYTSIGYKKQIASGYFELIDKVIYPINICPHCRSEATFHRRVQEGGDVVGNVWRAQQSEGPEGFVYSKFDYCLDCHKEFLIELYIWKREK